jgi:hypothetical protein
MNKFFGEDGLFLMRLTGPGKVWLQSMSLPILARTLAPYLSSAGGTTVTGSLQSAALGGGLGVAVQEIGRLL